MASADARCVIVTGGTGALGRCLVASFLAEGDRVIVPWIVKSEAEALPDRKGLELFEADVAEERGASAVAERAGAADVLVNAVGGFAGGPGVHETELEVWDRLYRINVRTAVAMTRAVLPAMLARGTGVIINIAARAAHDCPAGISAYSASKAAVVALTKSLHNEIRAEVRAEPGAQGIRVNAIEPTTIDTPANRAGMPDADFSTWTPPQEIARVVLWLASRDACTVSGGIIPV